MYAGMHILLVLLRARLCHIVAGNINMWWVENATRHTVCCWMRMCYVQMWWVTSFFWKNILFGCITQVVWFGLKNFLYLSVLFHGMQYVAFLNVKSHISACKKPPFTGQNAVSYKSCCFRISLPSWGVDNRLCKVSRNINFYVAMFCWPVVSTQIVISFQSVFLLYFEGIFVRFFTGMAGCTKKKWT